MKSPIQTAISRNATPAGYPQRSLVPERLTPWSMDFSDYTPVEHDMPRALTPARKLGDYPDPRDPRLINWATRIASYNGDIHLKFDDITGRPLNPLGRTGISGRGMQNAWGVTDCEDVVPTRDGVTAGSLEMLAIIRMDNGTISTIGGKRIVNEFNEVIEPTDETVARESEEEVGVKIDCHDGEVLYEGDIDDERNTDNSWYRSRIVRVHLDRDLTLGMELKPSKGEVKKVLWVPIEATLTNRLNAGIGHLIIPKLLAS